MEVMKVGKAGLALIKQFEGCRLEAYRCSAGRWTIGYGHTDGVKKGMKITQQQAELIFQNDIVLFSKSVSNVIGSVNLNQNQFDALISFAYNCGIGNLKKSTLLMRIKENPNDERIGYEFLRWTYSNGRYLAGLARRRKAEAELYFSPIKEEDTNVKTENNLENE